MSTSGSCCRLNAGCGLEENDPAVSLQGSCLGTDPSPDGRESSFFELYPCEPVHGGALSTRVRKHLPSFLLLCFSPLLCPDDVRLRHVKAVWGSACACSLQ